MFPWSRLIETGNKEPSKYNIDYYDRESRKVHSMQNDMQRTR